MPQFDYQSAHEASMNFDLEVLEPFLIQLEANLHIGIDVDLLMGLVEHTDLNMQSALAIRCHFENASLDCAFQAHVDDIEAVNVFFYVPVKELADAIRAEMISFAEANDL